jgi:hypothetical protein
MILFEEVRGGGELSIQSAGGIFVFIDEIGGSRNDLLR